MIIDRLENVTSGFYPALLSADDKSGLAQRLAAGFQFLLEVDAAYAQPGRIEIDGDQVFALVQAYTSKPIDQGRSEAHRNYIDIHYVAEGEENMGYANIGDVTMGD